MEMCGYAVHWEGSNFDLTDKSGWLLDTSLEGNCPTVEEDLGLELIREIEAALIKQKARLNVLQGRHLEEHETKVVNGQELGSLQKLRELFPMTPAQVLERIPAKTGWRGESLPWNRRKRRRLEKASEVIIHLFSGPDAKYWERELAAPGREILCIDLAISKQQDLRRDDVTSYLQYLCQLGTVKGILGGPPCRSVSRLRHTQPGPPPLRSRHGLERFGLAHLDSWLQRRVDEDTTLWMRQLFIYTNWLRMLHELRSSL